MQNLLALFSIFTDSNIYAVSVPSAMPFPENTFKVPLFRLLVCISFTEQNPHQAHSCSQWVHHLEFVSLWFLAPCNPKESAWDCW